MTRHGPRHSGSEQPSVAFSTLGCKLNQYETDALATRFVDGGYRVVDFDGQSDVYIINSCTVTNRADRKSRNLFNRARRSGDAVAGAEHDESSPPLVVLTGCYVDSHRDELESDGTTLVVANERKSSIYELVQAFRRREVIHPSASVFDFPVPSRLLHTRTMLKVQDGCDNHCTFCIIPRVRGRATSRPVTEVLDAAREAIDGGARELVLTGVNMSRYSGEGGFAGLVERILELPGDCRVRISSLEPDGLDQRFVDLFHHPKMCRHLHLCLQSGSQRILLAMRRQYTYDEFVTIAGRLRGIDPQFNLTTDIIVGFPGESEQEFAKSLDAIRELRFGHVHTFPYSEREGTRAARLPDRIPARIRTERAALVRELAQQTKIDYRRGLIGAAQRLLVERVESGPDGQRTLRGLGEHYVPITVAAGPDNPARVNDFADVQTVDLTGDDEPALVGRGA